MLGYKFLNYDIDNNKIYLLGYELPLTASEKKILLSLMKARLEETSGLRAGDILAEISRGGISRGNVAVHICSINKKARTIGGRRLVLCNEDGKYYLNEFM